MLWNSGRIVYWDLDDIDEQKPLNVQSDHLKEDLAQVEYDGGTMLDIGWYPSFEPNGKVVVSVVKNGDWEAPVCRFVAKNVHELRKQIAIAICEIG